MTRVGWLSRVLVAVLLCARSLAAQPAAPALTVVSTGPSGVLASLDQANEIRIVFSEPMVTLGRIPAEVTAPFVAHHARHPRRLPLVGHDDAHLHAGPEAAAALCDVVHGHGRHLRHRRQRTHAGGAVHLHLHDAAPCGS